MPFILKNTLTLIHEDLFVRRATSTIVASEQSRLSPVDVSRLPGELALAGLEATRVKLERRCSHGAFSDARPPSPSRGHAGLRHCGVAASAWTLRHHDWCFASCRPSACAASWSWRSNPGADALSSWRLKHRFPVALAPEPSAEPRLAMPTRVASQRLCRAVSARLGRPFFDVVHSPPPACLPPTTPSPTRARSRAARASRARRFAPAMPLFPGVRRPASGARFLARWPARAGWRESGAGQDRAVMRRTRGKSAQAPLCGQLEAGRAAGESLPQSQHTSRSDAYSFSSSRTSTSRAMVDPKMEKVFVCRIKALIHYNLMNENIIGFPLYKIHPFV
jgi:hypothetical protein